MISADQIARAVSGQMVPFGTGAYCVGERFRGRGLAYSFLVNVPSYRGWRGFIAEVDYFDKL